MKKTATSVLHSIAVSCLVILLGLLPAKLQAAGVLIEPYGTMAEFQGSALFGFIQTLPGGPAANAAFNIFGVQQGAVDVPTNSAGGLDNSVVSVEVLQAVTGAPQVLSGSSTSADYFKQFVSLGNDESGGTPPYLTLEIPRVWSGPSGGYLGIYDIAVIDLGKNLTDDTGLKNREATIFQVELLSEGIVYEIGSISGSEGNYINVILLDITGVPGMPPEVDGLRLVDISHDDGRKGSLDVDGVLRLNSDTATQDLGMTWGRIKALHR